MLQTGDMCAGWAHMNQEPVRVHVDAVATTTEMAVGGSLLQQATSPLLST